MTESDYEEVRLLINKIYRQTKVESALGIEWANYPIELFDEVMEFVTRSWGEERDKNV